MFGRYLRELKSGALKLDKAKIAAEAKLDGKYLISTSDDHLSTEDVVLGYKQLHEIERVNRDLKHTVDVRPVYHRHGDRVKAHVLLCWLALLLIRIAENESGASWHQLKQVFRPLLVGFHATQHGDIAQTNKLTPEQKRVLDAVGVKPPKRYLEVPSPQKASLRSTTTPGSGTGPQPLFESRSERRSGVFPDAPSSHGRSHHRTFVDLVANQLLDDATIPHHEDTVAQGH